MKLKNRASCTACGACLAVCPKDAITMEEDRCGYLYPKIDGAKCISCGLCERICHGGEEKRLPLQAFAAVGTEDHLTENSASGGVFATLAKSCMEQGGLAAGAVMEFYKHDLQVQHILSDRMDGLRQMQGSKYVQSEAWHCYEAVRSALKDGKTVLFSGTPCQVAAIQKLTGNPENLITADLICHGVPPQKMLRDYTKILSKRFWGRVTGFSFRDKSRKKEFCARLEFKNRRYYLPSSALSFYALFLKGSIYRENCYACPYASLERISDLTMGDYWGIEDHHETQGKNWSCLLVSTEKGQNFLKAHGKYLSLLATQAEWIAAKNGQLKAPSQMPSDREAVLGAYAAEGYRGVERIFLRDYGGALRYYRHTLKKLRRNQTSSKDQHP